MNPPANLDDLILVLEMGSEEVSVYFDRETGRIVTVESSTRAAVEDEDEAKLTALPDWQRAEIELARAILRDEESDGTRFIAPPDKFEFHEYHQMERFIRTIETAEIAEQLWRAIKGKGAFRHFKDTVYRVGLEKRWYTFRDQAMKDFVLAWAEANRVAVVEEPRRPPG